MWSWDDVGRIVCETFSLVLKPIQNQFNRIFKNVKIDFEMAMELNLLFNWICGKFNHLKFCAVHTLLQLWA